MLKSLRKLNSGFTIIEVLIVLAIAGLILLIVFLAVPALQRNSRNTQYRSEAARLLSSATEAMNNKGGTIIAAADSAQVLANANTKNITTLNIQAGAVATITPNFSTAYLLTQATCPAYAATAGVGITASEIGTNAPARALALIYAIEKNDGTSIGQCIES